MERDSLYKLHPELAKKLLETEVRKTELECVEIDARLDIFRADKEKRDTTNGEFRTYDFFDVVHERSVNHCIDTIRNWARVLARRGERDTPITITFNSPGGSVIDGLALFDHLKQLEAEGVTINTHAIGYAASMGGILLQAGQQRTMGKNCYILIHEMSTISHGKMSEIEDQLAFDKALQNKLVAILAERSTLSPNQIKRKWKKTDWWLDCDEALKLGFVDEVI